MFNNYQGKKLTTKKRNSKKLTVLSVKNKKIIIIVTLIVSIIFIVVFSNYQRRADNYNNLKQDKDKYIVYTKYSDTSGTYKKEIPFINMKADVIKLVNKDIIIFCNDFIELERSVINYEYDINGIILSVVVKIVDNETEYAPEVYFRTYNINLETEQVIADEALLNFYQTNEQQVEEKIKLGFKRFYNDIVMKEYFDPTECNYECFMKWRGVQNYLDDVNFYIKDSKLIAYKPFIFYSLFGEENYFKDSDFEFVIADAPETN